MDTSLLIAKFIGPLILVSGFAMLVNKQNMRAVFEDFLASPALIFVAGFLALLMGLALVIFHNRWAADWTVIITVYGWLALAAGIVRMSFPQVVKKMGAFFFEREGFLTFAGIANVLLGAFFTYKGFLA